MSDRLSEIRDIVEKKKQKAEEHKKLVEAGEIRSETETELREVALGAEKAIETVWDTLVDITGSDEQRAKTYKELTGRDTQKVEKDIEKYATHGTASGSQKMLQQVAPEVAATVLTSKLAAISKIGRAFDKAGGIKRTGIVAGGGAVENVIADALSQNLTPEGETSLTKIEPSKVAESAAIGATVVGGIYGTGKLIKEGLKASPSIVSTVEKTSNKLKENVSKIKDNYATKMDKDGESIFSKIDPTLRNSKDIPMAKRVGRTATRIAVRLAGREAQHMYHTFKDIGKEIYQESYDLIKTKYKNVKNIDTNKVAEEVVENIKNKFKKPKEAPEGTKTEKTTESTPKVEKSFVDDLPHSFKEKILDSDFVQQTRAKFENISNSKVFTDNTFSTYVELAGDKAKKILQDLDKKYIDTGSITRSDIKETISKIFDEVEAKFNIKPKQSDNLKDILNKPNVDRESTIMFDKINIKPTKNTKVWNKDELEIGKEYYLNKQIEEADETIDIDLYNKLKPALSENIKIKMTGDNLVNSSGDKISGGYKGDTDEIIINSNLPKEEIKRTINHELVHAAVSKKINNSNALKNELNSIYKRYRKNLNSKNAEGAYKIGNKTEGDELLADFFSYKPIKDSASKIKLKKEDITLYEKIADFIRTKVFGKDSQLTLDNKLNKILDKIVNDKKSLIKQVDEKITKGINKVEKKIVDTLANNNILKVSDNGNVTLLGLETDSFRAIMNDLGISNKEIYSKIVDLRNRTQGMVNNAKMVSKAIAKKIKASGLDNETLENINYGRVATAIKRHGKEFLNDSNTIREIARKHNISEEEIIRIVSLIGEGSGNKLYKNVEQAFNFESSLKNIRNKADAMIDIEKAIAYTYYNKKPFDIDMHQDVINTIADVERIENTVFNENIQFGYSGYYSPYKVEIKVSSSKKPQEGWKQVADSNTFYRLDLEGNISDGIVPISNDAFQGTIITKDIKKNIARLRRNNIPYGLEKSKDGKVTIRLYPDNRLAKELSYETDMSKRIANKYTTLVKNMIRNKVVESIDNDVKDLFSTRPRDGYVLIDKDIAPNFRGLFDIGTDEIYVKKEFSDILAGAKETLLYNGDKRLLRAAEASYKDLIKRFKRGVTVKSISSVLNNYLVIPSMLKGNGISLRDIPSAMKQAHIDYADFVKGIEKYQDLRTRNVRVANAYLKHFMETNKVAKLSKEGGIQSAIDDRLLNIANETDHIHYGLRNIIKKLSSNKTADTIMNVVDFVNLSPNSSIGSFMMNKFVMTDVVGRIAMYDGLLKQGKTHMQAVKTTNDMFVNFSVPYPKSIRILEEYGVPFIGWMYRMQLPLYTMAKNNPTSVASIVGLYLALESMGNSEGHMGDLKIDSWFINNSFADTNVLYSSPLSKGELIPDIKPQVIDEAIGVSQGNKSPLELLGFNIK